MAERQEEVYILAVHADELTAAGEVKVERCSHLTLLDFAVNLHMGKRKRKMVKGGMKEWGTKKSRK
jgi:hypothetical protein